jgi:anti-anti-sigma regulatory factor
MNANGIRRNEWNPEPVSVLHCENVLDRLNYDTLVQAARAELDSGAMRIIIDMTETDAVSLAGAIGLYLVGELSEGSAGQIWAVIQDVPIDHVDGWTLIHRMHASIQSGRLYPQVLIVARNKRLLRSLHELGLSHLIRTVPTLEQAIWGNLSHRGVPRRA